MKDRMVMESDAKYYKRLSEAQEAEIDELENTIAAMRTNQKPQPRGDFVLVVRRRESQVKNSQNEFMISRSFETRKQALVYAERMYPHQQYRLVDMEVELVE